MANLKSFTYSAASTIFLLWGSAMLMPALADSKLPIMYDDKAVSADNDVEGVEKTIEHNFSPEDRARLRKALDDYSKNTDPEHHLIETKRKAMKESVEERFLECDKDSDETIDREEATNCLPQVARHFTFVDIDEDDLITLEELELAQAKSDERQKQAEIKLEAQRIQQIEAELKSKKLLKNNKQALNSRKRPS
jgi:Ca2+-binding EF-hand superfamily protein